jgi:hypothetical protein
MHTPIHTIYVDVDEVLASWLAPTLALLGHTVEGVTEAWAQHHPRPWDLFQVLSIPPDRAWQIIAEAGWKHWARLRRFPWADPLLARCREIAPTYLLTSPCVLGAEECVKGKVAWMQVHFGPNFRDYLITSQKHLLARPGAVLIDDHPDHCKRFTEHGGASILFPGLGNEHHALRHDPLPHVLARLSDITTPC